METSLRKLIRNILKESFDFAAQERDYHDSQHYLGTKPVTTSVGVTSFKFIANDADSFNKMKLEEFIQKHATYIDENQLTITFQDVEKTVLSEVRRLIFSNTIKGRISMF
jgi:hypothetical protein